MQVTARRTAAVIATALVETTTTLLVPGSAATAAPPAGFATCAAAPGQECIRREAAMTPATWIVPDGVTEAEFTLQGAAGERGDEYENHRRRRRSAGGVPPGHPG
jgi:hypothetical protein